MRIEQTQILKKTFKNPSQKFIDDEVEKIVKEEKREIRYALEILHYLFKERTYSKELSYIELIKTYLVIFPEFLKEHLENNFIPLYKSFLYYLEFHHKVDQTEQIIKQKDSSELQCHGEKKKISFFRRNNQSKLPQRKRMD